MRGSNGRRRPRHPPLHQIIPGFYFNCILSLSVSFHSITRFLIRVLVQLCFKMAETWLVVGASRGIGLEFVKQLLDRGHNVIAGVRNPSGAKHLSQLISSHFSQSKPGRCLVEQCDVTSEDSINVSVNQTR